MTMLGIWIIGNAISCQQIVSRALLEDMGRMQREKRIAGNRAQRRGRGRRR